jgi:hypothetical protein
MSLALAHLLPALPKPYIAALPANSKGLPKTAPATTSAPTGSVPETNPAPVLEALR